MPAIVPDAVGRQYLRVVTSCLNPWRGHIDFDDLIAYCTLRVMLKLSRIPEEARLAAVGLVVTVARAAVGDFMASPQNRLRTTESRGLPVPTPCVLEEESELYGTEPDFAPPLIHRLWCRQVWREARALMVQEEAVTCDMHYGGDVSMIEIARRSGVPLPTVKRRLHRGLNRYREQEGLPLTPDGRRH